MIGGDFIDVSELPITVWAGNDWEIDRTEFRFVDSRPKRDFCFRRETVFIQHYFSGINVSRTMVREWFR